MPPIVCLIRKNICINNKYITIWLFYYIIVADHAKAIDRDKLNNVSRFPVS